LERAYNSGIEKVIITGTTLQDSKDALRLAQTLQPLSKVRLFSTAGIHPTNAADKPVGWQRELIELVSNNQNTIVAFGEMGIDNLRLQHCPLSTQMDTFIEQLQLVKAHDSRKLPLFVHCREASTQISYCFDKVWPNGEELQRSVIIHSFDGSESELKGFLERGFYISLNGCSFKQDGALQVMRKVPLSRLLLETDAPWCQITSTSAAFSLKEAYDSAKEREFKFPWWQVVKKEKHSEEAMVKGRNEPANLVQIFKVMSVLLEIPIAKLAEEVWNNAHSIFWPNQGE
jgi:TatD DNase family protein